MDRIYTTCDEDLQFFFKKWATDNGYLYKAEQNWFNTLFFEQIGQKRQELKLSIKLNNNGYRRYPYMDTFRRYDPRIGKLYNDDNQESDQEGCYILEDTGGGYSEVEGGVWSEWHDRMIPEDEAVYSDPYGDHLLRDYAVRIDVGSSRRRGWYHQDDDDIVYDEHSDEYVHVDDAVYSEIYGNWIWDERAVKTITEIHTDGDVENSVYFNSDDYKNGVNQAQRDPNLAMYQSDHEQFGLDGTPLKPEGRPSWPTTLISDKSRVYKGGSWRDRAYWLATGNRRFLDEDKSTCTIGFRCAMDRFGSQEGNGFKNGNQFSNRRQNTRKK